MHARSGPRGYPGPAPAHQWDGTKLRFENHSGWGEWIDIKGLTGQPGADGKDGKNGADGEPGQHGKDGIGIRKMLLVDGKLVVDFTDGKKAVLPIPLPENGKDGVNGEDGRGISTIRQIADNRLQIVYTDGDSQEFSLPRGVDGSQVELRSQGNLLQWKYVDQDDWIDLLQIDGLTRAGGGSFKLGALSDVDVKNAEDGEVLIRVNGKWVSTTIPAALALNLPRTIMPAGTTGNTEINTPLGRVNFAENEISLTVTSNLVRDESMVFANVVSNDSVVTGVFVIQTIPANGSFMLVLNAMPMAEVAVNFWVV